MIDGGHQIVLAAVRGRVLVDPDDPHVEAVDEVPEGEGAPTGGHAEDGTAEHGVVPIGGVRVIGVEVMTLERNSMDYFNMFYNY